MFQVIEQLFELGFVELRFCDVVKVPTVSEEKKYCCAKPSNLAENLKVVAMKVLTVHKVSQNLSPNGGSVKL